MNCKEPIKVREHSCSFKNELLLQNDCKGEKRAHGGVFAERMRLLNVRKRLTLT